MLMSAEHMLKYIKTRCPYGSENFKGCCRICHLLEEQIKEEHKTELRKNGIHIWE